MESDTAEVPEDRGAQGESRVISIGEEDEARRDVGAGAGGGRWGIGGVSMMIGEVGSSGDPLVRNSPFAKSVERKSRKIRIYPSIWQPDTQTFPSGTLQSRAWIKDLRLNLVTAWLLLF